MANVLQPDCYGHCGRKAAPGRMFCSTRCAAEYVDEVVRGNDEHWCPPCNSWRGEEFGDAERLICGHVRTGIREGMKFADAGKRYDAAIAEAQAQYDVFGRRITTSNDLRTSTAARASGLVPSGRNNNERHNGS